MLNKGLDLKNDVLKAGDNGKKKNNPDSSIVSSTSSNNSTEQVQSASDTVWVSKNGGKVYHKDKTCSGMKNPVQMTLEEAEVEGLRPCSKCVK